MDHNRNINNTNPCPYLGRCIIVGKYDECQTPFTKCWCEAVPGRMNNSHCQSLLPSVSIQSDVLTLVLVAGILVYMWRIFKPIKR